MSLIRTRYQRIICRLRFAIVVIGIILVSLIIVGHNSIAYVAARGDINLLRVLIITDANLNIKDNEGKTALMYIAAMPEQSVVAIIQSMIIRGVDVNAKDNLGTTVLLFSLLRSETNCRVIDMLIAASVNVNMSDSFGETALMWSIRRSYDDSCTVKALLTAGADMNAKDKYGKSVLAMAKVYLRDDIVAILKEALPQKPR